MLELKNVASGYGTIQVLRGISMEIKEGELVAVIGRNGVGKTTLMKTIMGVVRTMDGSILFNGKDYTKLRPHTRANDGIGYVEQGHGIFPDLTVEENLKMGLKINTAVKDKSLDIAYEYFPILFERKRQKGGTLSGGQQAMLSIARVLVGQPKLMILDEPSEGIQPNVVHQIGEIIIKCNQELGLTTLMVEQHLRLIQQTAQRAYAIDKGIVVGQLTREDLMDNAVVNSYLTV